jgi:hypothetical protein
MWRWSRLAALTVLGSIVAMSARAEEKRKYVGVDGCKQCHTDDKKGNQVGQWMKSKHAQAFDVLTSDKAKEVAKKAGVEDPQKSEKCLKCHVTEAGLDKSLLAESYKANQGVQCESCHGPGDDYSDAIVMKDRKKSIENGLVIPDEKTCTKCHNSESPTFKSFDFKEFFPKISHPNPEKKK